MRRLTISIWAIIATVAICLAATFTVLSVRRIYRWYHPYDDQELVGPTVLDFNWREIKPQSLLHSRRQRQMIALDLDPSIQPQVGGSLVLPDGSVVKVEVILIGSDGKTFELSQGAAFEGNDGTNLAYFYLFDLPKNMTFDTVRIRSSGVLPCKRIFWRDYNSWEAESPF
jgi:hypothetical protein